MTATRVRGLHLAVRSGKIKLVEKSLKNADVNALDSGYTPLMLAAISGHLQIVQLLCEHGANVNQLSGCAAPALMQAVISRHIEIIKLLLSYGADVNQLYDGYVALMISMWPNAFALQSRIQITQILLAAGARLDLNVLTQARNIMESRRTCSLMEYAEKESPPEIFHLVLNVLREKTAKYELLINNLRQDRYSLFSTIPNDVIQYMIIPMMKDYRGLVVKHYSYADQEPVFAHGCKMV